MVSRITAVELKALHDSTDDYVLIDTRRAGDYRELHIPGARNFRFDPNDVPSDEEIRAAFDDVDRDDRIVLICARGISAADLIDRLDGMGYHNLQMVEGGMLGWSRVYDTVTLPLGDGCHLIQLQRRAKGCLGYVIGARSSDTAVIVDPTRHTDVFRDAASAAGFEIEAVVDTHVHADHISGAVSLAADLDVPYLVGTPTSAEGIDHDHETINPNETVHVGSIPVKFLHVPGHTAGMMNLLVGDQAVLTADTLHVDSVGRVELAFDDAAADGARMLHDSLHRTVLSLPDALSVFPGHVSVTSQGEFENATPGMPIGNTLGRVREAVAVLDLDREAFVDRLTTDPPDEPRNYETIVGTNRGRDAPADAEEAEQLELGPNRCAA